MLFNSNVFIFGFLPATLFLFYLTRRKFGANASFLVLFLLSLAYYGWWDVSLLPLLFGSLAVNIVIAGQIFSSKSRWLLVSGITFNLGLLGVFKYTGLIERTIESALAFQLDWPEIVLPIGISFYTFQQIAYLLDVYSRTDMERPTPHKYGLFICFFPQLIAGPIVHHKEMMSQFEESIARYKVLEMAALGLICFSIGLAKKLLIADPLGIVASPIFLRAETGIDIHFLIAWIGALAYTFQIYFDFSGYSDMAIGLALMFGIRLPLNFNSPYKARSIIDFWRRWHMTLSRFLRDYLYIPLGGSRKGVLRRYVNLMLVMLIGGLWHGASWTFMLWGGLHGLMLMVNYGWRAAIFGRAGWVSSLGAWLAWPLTFLGVVLAWVTFRAVTFDGALTMYYAMSGLDGISLPLEARPLVQALGFNESIYLFAENSRREFYIGVLYIIGAASIAFCAPNMPQMLDRLQPALEKVEPPKDFIGRAMTLSPAVAFSASSACLVAFLMYLSIITLNSGQETEFLYFQF